MFVSRNYDVDISEITNFREKCLQFRVDTKDVISRNTQVLRNLNLFRGIFEISRNFVTIFYNNIYNVIMTSW
jgi:hypothetical protein